MTQRDLFACACGEVHLPHFLPNYDPPEWVIGRPPRCGENLYAPTRAEVLEQWEAVNAS